MFQPQMINTVLDWERRLEIEDEQRKHHRGQPFVNHLAEPQSPWQRKPSFFARLLPPIEIHLEIRRRVDPCCPPEPRRGLQMG